MNNSAGGLSIDERQRGDNSLLHALLLHLCDERAAEDREARVQSAMRAVREVQESPDAAADGKPESRILRLRTWAIRPKTNWRAVSTAAALVALTVGSFVFSYAARPALASARQVLTALLQPGDRTFKIGVFPAQSEPKHGLNDATLYLRDGQQYLLARLNEKGGEVLDGYDGRISWRIRAGRLVEAQEGPGAGGLPVPKLMADAPFLDLRRTLNGIQRDYAVEQFDLAAPSVDGPPLRHMLARRISNGTKGPGTIEIWANPHTGTPRRIVFDDAKFQGNSEPRRLTFELVNETPLPANWFSAAAHQESPH